MSAVVRKKPRTFWIRYIAAVHRRIASGSRQLSPLKDLRLFWHLAWRLWGLTKTLQAGALSTTSCYCAVTFTVKYKL